MTVQGFRLLGNIAGVVLALALIGGSPSLAQAQNADDHRPGWLDDLLHGELLLRSFVHLNDQPGQDRSVVELLISQDVEFQLSARQSVVAEFEYRGDTRNFTSGILDDIVEEQERRYHLNARQAYYQVSLDKVDLFIGKRVWAWGTADSYNPTDNINPTDLSDFLVGEEIGVPGIGLAYSGIRTSLDVALLPWFTPARLPGVGTRWAVAPQPSDLAGLVPPGALIVVGDRTFPTRKADNLQGAARLKLTRGGTDIAFSWFHGFDPIPAAQAVASGVLPGPAPQPFVEVGQVYNEIDEFGLALASTVGELGVHLEASYRATADGHDEDFLTWVAGINRAWYHGGSMEELRLTLEYADETLVHDNGSSDRLTSVFNRPLKDTLLGDMTFEFGLDFSASLAISYNTRDQDYMMEPSITRGFAGKYKLEIGAQLIEGDPGTFWGNWSRNDRFFTHFTYLF